MSNFDRLVNALPDWMRSVRFRLTLFYSTALFLLAAVLVGTLYLALSSTLNDESVSRTFGVGMAEFERAVNAHTLADLKKFSFAGLGLLFLVSLGVGYVVSGRVLRPIDRITEVATRIQATDLSRRIALQGPHDELKRLADTFDSMLERIDEGFSAQRRFVADASHELRNPLAVIRTNLDVALSDTTLSEEELRETARVARRASERMSRMVDDLLALARLDGAAPAREAVDLSGTILEIADEFEALALQRFIRLERTVEPDVKVLGDRDALKRAVANLLDNAIGFAPERSTVALSAGTRGAWAWVSVADQGPGIDPADQTHIFDRFWRADRTRTRGAPGSGLGLAIVKQVAEAHSGQVRVESRPNEGATFWLVLPAADGGPASGTTSALRDVAETEPSML